MNKFLLIILSTLLVSCVKIDYQRFKTLSGGYKYEPVGDGKHSISYEMYGIVDPELVKERWHIRASELCLNGYDVESFYRDKRYCFGTCDTVYKGVVQCKN